MYFYLNLYIYIYKEQRERLEKLRGIIDTFYLDLCEKDK
jgi:hypothetical protein